MGISLSVHQLLRDHAPQVTYSPPLANSYLGIRWRRKARCTLRALQFQELGKPQPVKRITHRETYDYRQTSPTAVKLITLKHNSYFHLYSVKNPPYRKMFSSEFVLNLSVFFTSCNEATVCSVLRKLANFT
jgi:hypothetical protein